uniref:FIP-RBD domain-containing protein n=1 Tax=Plectus sambesii TaxID=2011161 RepID=A0A914X6A0_9BILA
MAASSPSVLPQQPRSPMSQTAAEISVVIHGARNVWKKNGKSLHSMTFADTISIQNKHVRYTSSLASVVSDLLSLRISLREEQNTADEDRVIGRARIPIINLPDAANSKEYTIKLTSDQPKFQGYLLYRCYVTKYRPSGPYTPIEWTKRHAPLLIDYFRHFEWPKVNTECITGPFLKLWPNRNACTAEQDAPSFVAQKLMQASMMTQLTFGADVNELFPQVGQVALAKRKITLHEKAESLSTLKADISRKKSVMIMQNAIVIPASTAKDPIHFLSLFTNELTTAKTTSKRSFKRRNLSDPDLEQMGVERTNVNSGHKEPILSSVEPESGPVWGGTRITITGEHLGEDAADIVGLYVCGSNCLSTLEYESPNRISCVTKAWRACIGSVAVITTSGGRGVCATRFSFVPETDGNLLEVHDNVDTISLNDEPDLALHEDYRPRVTWTDLLRKVDESTQTSNEILSPVKLTQSQKVELDDLRELVETLQQQVRDLKETNQQQKRYVDALVARVIEECPTALCRLQRR